MRCSNFTTVFIYYNRLAKMECLLSALPHVQVAIIIYQLYRVVHNSLFRPSVALRVGYFSLKFPTGVCCGEEKESKIHIRIGGTIAGGWDTAPPLGWFFIRRFFFFNRQNTRSCTTRVKFNIAEIIINCVIKQYFEATSAKHTSRTRLAEIDFIISRRLLSYTTNMCDINSI